MTEHLELTVDELLLDQENPRLGATESQSETLERIVQWNPKYFRNLMASIRDDGLDPGDSLYVVQSDGNNDDFVVLEGNRRLSALKVLSNPDLLAGTDLPNSVTKSLIREATGFHLGDVEPIRCVRFDEREEANDWIRRRHTGVVDGEGRIGWKPLDIQRFTNDYSTIDVIEFVGRNAGYSEVEWEEAHTALGGRKSTNLTRMLESAAGRDHLGISFELVEDRKTPFLETDPTWALNVLRRMVDDIVSEKVDSRQLNRATDIEKYFAELPQELQLDSNVAVTKAKPFRSLNFPESQGIPPKPKPKRKAAPMKRRMLAPKKHLFDTTNSTKLGMLVSEAALLNIDRLPLSSAFVLRAIVELAVNDYMKKHNLPSQSPGGSEFSLAQKASSVADHLRSSSTVSSGDLQPFRKRLLSSTSACSIQSLNSFVHNRHALPTADDLRAGWESCIPLLIAIYGSA